MIKTIIIGATSAIAHATARLWASEDNALYLVARDPDKLEAIAQDLETRGAGQLETRVMDMLEQQQHQALVEDAVERLGGLDRVLIAHGTLPDQRACEASVDQTRRELEINCLSTISLVTRIASFFESQGSGTIAVITSVAGDRGRQSNYVYGTAKGALSLFLQGLRNRLYGSNVQVLTIKPGFVDTAMTREVDGLFWLITADRAAEIILRKAERGSTTAYVPARWRMVMAVIRSIPSIVFRRLKV